MSFNDFLSKDELEHILTERVNPEDISKIIGAYEMAEEALSDAIDPTGAPKFYHTTRVCKILLQELGIHEPDLIIAALLHNILLHSSEITLEILNYNFGSYVSYLIQLINDDYAERKGTKSSTIPPDSLDTQALYIILCDYLDILRTMEIASTLNPFKYIEEIKKRYFATAIKREDDKITYLLNELKKEFNKILG